MPVATRHYHCQHNMHTPPLWLQNPEQRAQSKRDYLVGVCFNAKVAAQRLHGLANMGHMAQEQQLIPLLAAKARADNLCGINTLSLGNSAWALSKCDLKDHTFFAAVNAAAAKYDFKDAPAAQQEAVWCKLLLAMALLGYAYKDTTEAAAQAPLATGRNAILQHVRPQHCAQALFSLARTGLMPESTTGPALVRALLNQFFSGVHEPPDIQTDLMVTNPLWALLLLGQVKENLPLAQKLLQLVESDRVQALLTQMGLGQLLQVSCFRQKFNSKADCCRTYVKQVPWLWLWQAHDLVASCSCQPAVCYVAFEHLLLLAVS